MPAQAATVPDTCDEDFWEVLRARAWEEANREVTQNQNLIAKPDSVLSYICFDEYLDHMARYAGNHGPEDPDRTGGFFYDLYVTFRQIPGSIDPYLTMGLDMNSVLEILILDNLTDGVSSLSGIEPAALLCGKDHYIDANFDHTFIGGRSGINAGLSSSVGSGSYNCNRMRQVYTFAKCYDFQERSHDGFFTFEQYRDTEAADNDYRMLPTECTDADSSTGDIICGYAIHGMPSIGGLIGWPWGGGTPTVWDTAFAAANPDPGAAGGADPAQSFWNLMDPAGCGSITPVHTGLIVSDPSGTRYTDAVCTAPGCWYQPGGSVGAAGSCNP